jgi:uncharacterized membrane protein YebE (DUF533 family)
MDTSFLLSTVLNGVLGARTKPSYRARHYLNGGLGSLLANPATLMTAAGLAWGVYETMQQQSGTTSTAASAMGGVSTPPPLPPPAAPAPTTGAPADGAALAPPLPGSDAAPATAGSHIEPAGALNEGVARLLRLAFSAANADGAMNAREKAVILQQATAAGVPEAALADLNQPRPLADVVAGVTSAGEAATLYVLAFTILRADEQVTTVERIYLAQLANLLHLDEATVQALEKNVGDRIDALGDQGQPGG